MAGKLTVNRHPVLIDNETQVVCDLQPGESLYSFLHRHIENLDGQQIAVTVNNELVDCADWHSLRPKDGANIYVRFVVQRSALMIVALVALSVFTAGAAAAIAGGAVSGMGGAFGAFLVGNMGALAANAVVGAIQIVGAMLINKVLGPKPASAGNMERDSVFNFSGTRNSSRQYEPLGLLLGSVRVTPDILSIPYTWYRDNDQYMGMVLTPGVNVDSFEPLSIGETPIANYEGVVVTTSGFSGMPEQTIPLYTNVDTLDGGALEAEHNVPGAWIERTGPADTIRLQVNLSYLLFDLTSKGKEKLNQETVIAQYRQVGTENWLTMGSYPLQSKVQTEQRRSFSRDVDRGQYEIRVRRLGRHTDGSGATCNMNLSGVSFIQADDVVYKGIARIGVEMLATGQLNGAPSQIRGLMHARTMPLWDGAQWIEATAQNGGISNPGAQILQYARGFRDSDGTLIAGMGLPDDLIDIESMQAFMVHCTENDFQYNHWITDARSHDDIINGIARAGMGRYSWAPGKLTMIWVAEGQPHEGVATMANIKSGEFQVDYSLSQAADGIEYTYVDRETWESKTLRVPAPGVSVMENPARLSGEGVGTEAHAALLARYHLGQNLYQFKDIVFGQDLEHMAYGELSVIMLSHDMTQWGFSGRLVAASRTSDGITVEIDQGVPLDATRTPYVGLRIPGEGNYRVFQVQRITDTMLRLVGNWPVGVPFPGDSDKNPAHDTIWLYDFKQTPGLRCRVVGLSPADNLNGASISVVPESDEFWNYVKTGEYLPPQQDSLLALRPSVRNLRLQEVVHNQGNTVYSEIHADWLVEGVATRFAVSVAEADGVYRHLTDTDGLSHDWRATGTGVVTVLVRPFDADGVPGVAQSATLEIYGANKPPVIVDNFDVLELSGGVRSYTWGFNADTIQSPDMAGVEIRTLAGTHGVANWDDMVPLGETGFYTAPFEATLPEAGPWTFALRTINTNGVLSKTHFVITRNLGNNLGEKLGEITESLNDITQAQVDAQMALDAEIAARLQGDLNAVTQAGTDATAKANAVLAQAKSYADSVAGGVSALTDAPNYEAEFEYKVGDFVKDNGGLWRAIADNYDQGPPDPEVWVYIGPFASVGEAVAANLSATETIATELSATAGSVQTLAASVGDISVEVQDVAQAVVDGDTALGLRIDSVTVTADGAASTAGNALTVANGAATNASTAMTTAGNAQSTATNALNTANDLASAITQVQAGMVEAPNTLKNPTFTDGLNHWNGRYGPTINQSAAIQDVQGGYVRIPGPGTTGDNYLIQQNVPIFAGNAYALSADLYYSNERQVPDLLLVYRNSAGDFLGEVYAPRTITAARANKWFRYTAKGTSPAGATKADVYLIIRAGTSDPVFFRRVKLEQNASASLYSEEQQYVTATEELRASVTGGGNMLTDSEFRGWPDQGTWSLAWNSQNLALDVGLNIAGPDWQVPGTNALSWFCNGAVNITSTAYVLYGSGVVACAEGSTYIASVYAAAHRCSAYVAIAFFNAANQNIGEVSEYPRMVANQYSGGKQLAHYRRCYVKAVAPAGAVQMRVYLWTQYDPGIQGGAPFVWFLRPMLEECRQGQTAPSPWSAGGKEMAASHTVSLDVNGYVSGTQSTNDGKRSSFSILANVFRVISGGAAGMEWLDGYLRMWKGSAQLVMGHSFGSGDLVFWYGPNIGAGSCSKGNGTIWFDNAGGAYFGGSLSAGVLKNASQTTVLTANPSIDVGPFTTLGRTKTVTVGYSASGPTIRAYFPGRPSNSPPPPQSVPAPAATTLYLYRRYGGGAEQLVTSSTIGHGAIEVFADYLDRDAFDPNLPNGGWYQDYYFISTGSMTVSDTTAGTNTFQYRAYAVSGGYQRDRQILSVISVEQ